MAFYRVHLQARQTRTFTLLSAAIAYIADVSPFWYALEGFEEDGCWQELVTPKEASIGRHYGQFETEESENLRADTTRPNQADHQQASAVGQPERIDVI